MFSAVVANASQDVVFNPKDFRPQDQQRSQSSAIFSRAVNYNGQHYTVMYEASQNNAGTISTRVVSICSIVFQNSFQQCRLDFRVPTATRDAIYQTVVNETKKAACSDIAFINNDHMKSRQAIEDFKAKAASRDNATNQREMAIIMNGLTNQVDSLGRKLNQNTYTENVVAAQQLLNIVANRQMQEQESMKHMSTNINILNANYADLLSKSQCSNEQLTLCAVNKQTNQVVTPGADEQSQHMFEELKRRGIIEIKSCSLAPKPATPQTPVIDNAPVVNEPQIQPLEGQTEAINPIVQ